MASASRSCDRRRRITGQQHGTGSLAVGALRRASRLFSQGNVLCGDRKTDKRKVWNGLHTQRGGRPRQAARAATPARTTSSSIVPCLPSGACLIVPPRPAVPNLNLPPKSAMKPARGQVALCRRPAPPGRAGRTRARRLSAIPMVATRTGRGSPSAAIRASRAPAIARRMRCLTRRSEAASARAAGPVVLRLISAA